MKNTDFIVGQKMAQIPNYTVYNNPRVNQKIFQDLELIEQELIKALRKQIIAILLVGGFGRGEGSVVTSGESIRIINDYDILVVARDIASVKKALYKKKLFGISKKLAQSLKIKQIDIGLISLSLLPTLPLNIFNYELLTGHKLIYGDLDLTKILPPFNPLLLPLYEGTRLLFNRGGGLLIAAKYFLNGQIKNKNKENFIIECQKAILAMGDCILLQEKKYHCLYTRRIKNIQSIKPQNELAYEIVPRYIEALEDKIRPDFEKYRETDLVKWWLDIQRIYKKFFLNFENNRLNRNLRDLSEYKEAILAEGMSLRPKIFKNMIRNLIAFGPFRIKWKNLVCDFEHILMSMLPSLLFVAPKGKSWKKEVNRYLKIWHPQ